jgi:hypothetical protein
MPPFKSSFSLIPSPYKKKNMSPLWPVIAPEPK